MLIYVYICSYSIYYLKEYEFLMLFKFFKIDKILEVNWKLTSFKLVISRSLNLNTTKIKCLYLRIAYELRVGINLLEQKVKDSIMK